MHDDDPNDTAQPPFAPLPCRMQVREQAWPLARPFTISRGTRHEARTIIVELQNDDGRTGRGEAVPYHRHGETADLVLADLQQARRAIEAGIGVHQLPHLLQTLAARNAVDCALWDLAGKHLRRPVWQLAGLPPPRPRTTACTLSLDTPAAMAEEARRRLRFPLLKLKLGASPADDAQRLQAVRDARPDATLIVDANEGWRQQHLPQLLDVCARAGVALVEQPLPAAHDGPLARMPHPVPLCADESVRGIDDLASLAGRYDAINVKLDKAGGFTPALALARAARRQGLQLMVGCMLASSLAMLPAFLLAPLARWIDLDAPLLLADDHPAPLHYDGATIHLRQG